MVRYITFIPESVMKITRDGSSLVINADMIFLGHFCKYVSRNSWEKFISAIGAINVYGLNLDKGVNSSKTNSIKKGYNIIRGTPL